jgi:hypothetical protein
MRDIHPVNPILVYLIILIAYVDRMVYVTMTVNREGYGKKQSLPPSLRLNGGTEEKHENLVRITIHSWERRTFLRSVR